MNNTPKIFRVQLMWQTLFNPKAIQSKEKLIPVDLLNALFVVKYTSVYSWAIISLDHLKNLTSYETAASLMAHNIVPNFNLQNAGSIKRQTHNLIYLRNNTLHIKVLLQMVTFISHKFCHLSQRIRFFQMRFHTRSHKMLMPVILHNSFNKSSNMICSLMLNDHIC